MNVVVVESPAKAKTINKYLGDGFTVVASYGHVRDLPAKDGSVRPDADFAMDWEVDGKAQKHIRSIADALRGAQRLYLATDPDREGEAISWHVCQVLKERKALEGVDIKRVVFNEITRSAILEAFERPRDLDQELVEAYLARRALDYLVGFTLSPVLWRKLPGSRSAGRVQSVALRLVCEREAEIEDFRAREYWTVEAAFRTAEGQKFDATLSCLRGRKLEKFDISNESAARDAVEVASGKNYAVDKVERKTTKRNPAPPFITSTLQQEAARKLGFSAKQTMQLAQRLYEGVAIGGETVGLITYMRTDGVQMAGDAVAGCRALIERDYGERYLPKSPRLYKTKVKNAQEAHEAIRPTDVSRRPQDIKAYLEPNQAKLYTLIWRRTLACQMEAALIDQTAVDIASDDRQAIFRATGSVIAFDGFLKVYREGRDEPEDAGRDRSSETGEDGERILPALRETDALVADAVTPVQHFTQPPPRFTEASLVKRLEELGIGRPSTYASIISVLQDRKYVRLDAKRFVPEDRGRLVTAFLTSFFDRYVAYGFTAEMEERLDDISGGRIEWTTVLSDFWRDFTTAVDGTKGLRVKEVLDALDRLLGPHFFREAESGRDARACPTCADGRLSLKLGKFGAFIGCSNYPDCRYTRPLAVPSEESEAEAARAGGNSERSLGVDAASGLEVVVRKGPYGHYLQLGAEKGGESSNGAAGVATTKAKSKGKAGANAAAPKPKRAALPPRVDPSALTLEQALAILALPRSLGVDPGTGAEITAGIGRFGPYLRMGDVFVSLKGDDDPLTITFDRSTEVIANAQSAGGKAVKNLGDHPGDGKPVRLRASRFGAAIEHGARRVKLPKGTQASAITLEVALGLLDLPAAPSSAKKAGAKGKATASKKSPASGRRSQTAEPEDVEPAGTKTHRGAMDLATHHRAAAPPKPAAATPSKANAKRPSRPKRAQRVSRASS